MPSAIKTDDGGIYKWNQFAGITNFLLTEFYIPYKKACPTAEARQAYMGYKSAPTPCVGSIVVAEEFSLRREAHVNAVGEFHFIAIGFLLDAGHFSVCLIPAYEGADGRKDEGGGDG